MSNIGRNKGRKKGREGGRKEGRKEERMGRRKEEGKEGFTLAHTLRVQFFMMGSVRWLGTLHLQKQRAMNSGSLSTSSLLFSSRSQLMEWCYPQLKSLLNSFILISPRQAQRCVSPMMIGPVKLTDSTKHHKALPINKTGSVIWDSFSIRTMLILNSHCLV